ncbi:MAG: hypothetical protein AMXMBFR82_23290 [Candidatus Hydrogenedentota bacterium]
MTSQRDLDPMFFGAGSRVCIRSPRRTDMTEFLRVVHESQDFHAPWVSPPSTPERFVEYVERAADPAFVALLLCALPDNRIAGAINLSNICYGNFCNACMGYWIGKSDRRSGLMTEGITLALYHAFNELNLHRVEANVQPDNIASIGLLKRLGFRLEGQSPRFLRIGGEWKDHDRWAICAEEFGSGK